MKPMTEEEIIGAVSRCQNMEDTSYLDCALICCDLRKFFQELKNHRVVEIGPGKNPVNRHFPCKEYLAATRRYTNDGLSVLRKEKDASAVIVSFGVIDECILGWQHKLSRTYTEELVCEIKRVMNPFSIIFSSDAEKYLGKADIDAIEFHSESGGVYFRK